MSALRISDKYGNAWQYHSRSDAHSKIACWSILFDLMLNCPLLRRQIEAGKVGFGINHTLRDFQTRRKKNLDLVVCTPGPEASARRGRAGQRIETFSDLVARHSVLLTAHESAVLQDLPGFHVVPVGSVNVALEAKATMTEHIKALPRLHDELDSSHLTIHGHTDHAIAAALVTINMATVFASSDRNKVQIEGHDRLFTQHQQPHAAERTIKKIHELRRRTGSGQAGFDAVGIVVVNFKNDGSDCELVSSPPAPDVADPFYYDQMINRIASLYQSKFAEL